MARLRQRLYRSRRATKSRTTATTMMPIGKCSAEHMEPPRKNRNRSWRVLGNDLFDDLAMDVCQTVVAALEPERQPLVIDAEQCSSVAFRSWMCTPSLTTL